MKGPVRLLTSWSVDRANGSAASGTRRTFVTYLKSIAAAESDFSAAELIYGELLANAVEHGCGRIVVSIYARGRELALTMSDEGNGIGQHSLARVSTENIRGRGLFIVNQLARSVDFPDATKSWVEVILPLRLNHEAGEAS